MREIGSYYIIIYGLLNYIYIYTKYKHKYEARSSKQHGCCSCIIIPYAKNADDYFMQSSKAMATQAFGFG